MARTGKVRSVETLNFNDLITILTNSRLQQTDKALYQVIYQILTRSTRNDQLTVQNIQEVVGSIAEIGDTIINITTISEALRNLSFLLAEPVPVDPTSSVVILPGARELLAGTNITFDDSVDNERTINASSGSGEISRERVTIPNADILTLPTTSVDLVPAPGTGFRLVFHRAILQLRVDTLYTNVNVDAWASLSFITGGGNFDVANYLGDSTAPNFAQLFKWLATGPFYSSIEFSPYSRIDIASYWGALVNASGDYTALENLPISLYVDNVGSGDFTGGVGTNQMVFDTYYSIIPMP